MFIREREQRVHNREREEFVGVNKHTLRSGHAASVVGEIGVSQRRDQCGVTFAKAAAIVAAFDDIAHEKYEVADTAILAGSRAAAAAVRDGR